MRTAIFTTAILFIFTATSMADNPPDRLINVSGEGTVYATPDKVIVQLGVEAFQQSLSQSKDQNDSGSSDLLKAIKTFGIDEKDLQVSQMNVEIIYNNFNQPIQGIQGYKTTRNYSVTLHDVKQLAPLIDVALKNGANRLQGFSYDTSELKDLRDRARSMALQEARQKATSMAAQLNCRIGHPVTISENGGEVTYLGARAMAFGGGAINAADMQQTMPTGQIPITCTVSVSFDLLDAP